MTITNRQKQILVVAVIIILVIAFWLYRTYGPGSVYTGARLSNTKAQILFQHSTGSSGADLYVLNVETQELVQLTRGAVSGGEAWSPNGQFIAFQQAAGGDNFYSDVYLLDVVNGSIQQLTNTPQVSERYSAWSPDSEQLLYIYNPQRSGIRTNYEIHLINRDGTGQQKLLNGFAAAWSPDGQQIAYSASTESKYEGDIYLMDADGSNARLLVETPEDKEVIAWSPDGTQLLYVVNIYDEIGGVEKKEVYIVNAEDGEFTYLTEGFQYSLLPISWLSGSQQVAFTDDFDQVCWIDVDTRERTCPFDGYSSQWSPDGQQVAFSTSDIIGQGILCIGMLSTSDERCYDDLITGVYVLGWRPSPTT